MKGWIGGLVVGVVLGSALAGAAQAWHQWLSATEILQKDGPTRSTYIAGVSDAIEAIIEAPSLANNLKARAACLATHQQHTMGDFLRWADGVVQSRIDEGYGDYNAASALIWDACK